MLILLYNAQFSTLIIAQAVLTYFIHAQKKQQPANNACNTNMSLNSHINCPWKRTHDL